MSSQEENFAKFLKTIINSDEFFIDTTDFQKIKSKKIIIEIIEKATGRKYTRGFNNWRSKIYPFIGCFSSTKDIFGIRELTKNSKVIDLKETWLVFNNFQNMKKSFSRNNNFNELYEKGVI